jgi:hypothetical protein
MGNASTFRDMAIKQPVVMRRRAAGTAGSGVVNCSSPRGERLFLIVMKGQNSGAGAIKAKFAESDTVSATYSGMTLFASATNFTASAVGSNAYAYDIALNGKRKKFIGVLLSTGTASAIGGVIGFVGDLKVSPPSATDDGFVGSVTTIA